MMTLIRSVPPAARVAIRVAVRILRRLIQLLPTLVGLSLVTFFLVHLLPGGPAQALAGVKATPEITREINAELGLDDPLPVQYLRYVGRLAQGDLGTSFISGTSVAEILQDHLGVTLLLIGYAVVLAMVLGVPLAVVAARRAGRLPDHLVRLVTVAVFGLPSFWVGLLLIAFLALQLRIFPTGGTGEGLMDELYHLFLPALTLSVGFLVVLVRSLRSRLIELLRAEFVDAVRLKGVSGLRVLVLHILRVALVPVVALVGVNVSYLLGTSVIVENVFAVDGIGQQLVGAILQRDFLVVQGVVLTFGVLVVAIGFVAELVQAGLDPRIAMEGR